MSEREWIYYEKTPRSDPILFFYLVRLTGRDVFEQMFVLGITNLVAVLSLLLPPLFPPALAGLWVAAARTARAEEPTFRLVLEAARARWRAAWGLFLVALPFYAITLMNVAFYAQDQVPLPFEVGADFVPVVRYTWVFIGLLWTAIVLYAAGWSVFEEARVVPAFRQALRLLVQHPLYTLLLILLLALLLVINIFVPAFALFLTGATLAVLSVRSVQLLEHGVPQDVPPDVMEQRYG